MPHKLNAKGFAAIEAVLVVVALALIAGTAYYVWHSRDNANSIYSSNSKPTNVTFVDSTKLYSLQYPSSWKLQLEQPGGEGTAPDWSKESRGADFVPPNTPANSGNAADVSVSVLDATTANSTIASSKQDKFHSVQNLTINGNKTVYDKLVFTGPSDAERYTDDYYYVFHGDKVVRLNFREKYYHNYPYENWSDTKNLPGFNSIVQSIKFLTKVSVSKSSISTATATDTQHYFAITQWQVRAPYNGDQTLVYAITYDNGNVSDASVTSTQLKLKAQYDCTAGGGVIRRATANQIVAGNAPPGVTAQAYAAANPSLAAQIGSYYYLYLPNQDTSSCGSSTATTQMQVEKDVQTLVPDLVAY